MAQTQGIDVTQKRGAQEVYAVRLWSYTTPWKYWCFITCAGAE